MGSTYDFEASITGGTPVEVVRGDWGKGVHIREGGEARKGEVLWKERPVVVGSCRSPEGVACGNCCMPTRAHGSAVVPLPAIPPGCEGALPSFEQTSAYPEGISCEHGCEWYCSTACLEEASTKYHSVCCGGEYRSFLSHLIELVGEKSANQRVLALKLLCASAMSPDPRVAGHVSALVALPHEVSAEPAQRKVEVEVFEAFMACVKPGVAAEGLVTFEAYLVMLSKMKANAVELDLWLKVGDEEEAASADAAQRSAVKASGLFALQAFVNHSCVPNGHRVFYNGMLHFVAVRDIPPGEQVLMAYVNPTNTIKDRQAKLSSHWRITCTCEKCAAEAVKLILFRQLLSGLKQKKDDRKDSAGEAKQVQEE
eukprot:TRINITY_DN10463_c1_g1_i1.p1 TRINITY_DN10463_c1_g1~~TRINITY_DN10463_c1_g1_i1.p1  ORF type:complete len:382 (+),score=112.59 TRINITY_DN10463_c1_g1_i1:40-1146(+)